MCRNGARTSGLVVSIMDGIPIAENKTSAPALRLGLAAVNIRRCGIVFGSQGFALGRSRSKAGHRCQARCNGKRIRLP